MNLPEGLIYHSDFITPQEEEYIIKKIDQKPWSNVINRRTQHYGYVYDYTKKNTLTPAPKIEPVMERILKQAKENVMELRNFNADQVIVNEYEPGQGIGAHIDNPRIFGPIIVSLSLGSATNMIFSRSNEKYIVRLEPRSLTIMTNEARYEYTHQIPSVLSDTYLGSQIERQRRVSLTFREKLKK